MFYLPPNGEKKSSLRRALAGYRLAALLNEIFKQARQKCPTYGGSEALADANVNPPHLSALDSLPPQRRIPPMKAECFFTGPALARHDPKKDREQGLRR